MRVLLDENLLVDLAPLLTGFEVDTVTGVGWEGVLNGELLRRAGGTYGALVTMGRNLEFQQPLDRQPFGAVLVSAPSNRLRDLRPLVPAVLEALRDIQPGELRRVGG